MLRPHQVEPARAIFSILREHQSAVDWSEMGVGKTYVAAWVIKQLDLPTLVVGPKISRTAWANALHTLGTGASFCNYELLRIGRLPYGTWDSFKPASEYFKCTICQCRVDLSRFAPCYAHPRGIHCLDAKKISAQY